jgi:hypothetical protein
LSTLRLVDVPGFAPWLWLLLPLLVGCAGDPAGDTRAHDRPTVRERPSDPTPAVTTAAWFEDVASPAGINFVPRNGQEAGHCSILETLGVGVALFDYDGDGDVDLFVPGGGRFGAQQEVLGLPAALFRNEDGVRFSEVTAQARCGDAPFYSHGAVVGDYDSDGMPDVLITGYNGLLLYRNNGDGTFRENAEAAGLLDDTWSTSAAWGDMNADGVLDLYVVNYVDWSFDNHPFCGPSPTQRDVCSPGDFDAISDRFYLGNGDGTFREAAREVGLEFGGKGLGALAADVDLDGDLDYYVTNDTTPNFLYRNDGQGRLEEVGLISGAALSDMAQADGSMGVDLGDFDQDGLPDLWVANFEDQSFALYRNDGDCMFSHVSAPTGITSARGVYVGFGTAFFDFDRDGDEDLFASTGHVMYHPRNSSIRQLPLLFENRSGQKFVNVAARAGPYMQSRHIGRGVALGDVDDDGAPDLAVAHTNEPISLLLNRSKCDGHWLSLRLIGTTCHRDAVGARITVSAGGLTLTRQVKGGSSFLSSNDPRVLVGLGPSATIDRLEIHWPSGATQTLTDVPADRKIVLLEP